MSVQCLSRKPGDRLVRRMSMGCRFGQNAAATMSPFLDTWISWETVTVSCYYLPGHVLGEKAQ